MISLKYIPVAFVIGFKKRKKKDCKNLCCGHLIISVPLSKAYTC